MLNAVKKTSIDWRLQALIGVSLCLLAPLANAKLFKWVDEEGNVYYSDKVPPQHVERKREVINESGVRSVVVDEAKTKEALVAERKAAELRKQEEENLRKAEEYKRNLLANYRDERDLIATRDRNIESIQVSINFVEANLAGLHFDLEALVKEAASYERSGKQTPKLLKTEIAETRGKIDEAETFIREKQAEQAAVRDHFNEDLELYRVLTGTQRNDATAR